VKGGERCRLVSLFQEEHGTRNTEHDLYNDPTLRLRLPEYRFKTQRNGRSEGKGTRQPGHQPLSLPYSSSALTTPTAAHKCVLPTSERGIHPEGTCTPVFAIGHVSLHLSFRASACPFGNALNVLASSSQKNILVSSSSCEGELKGDHA
jgi:hypothetical protein